MFKKLFFISPLAVGLSLLISSYSGTQTRYPGGSPGGYTGSPGDGHTCTVCHGGAATQLTGWITSNIPAEGYIPGATYNITVTVSGSGKKGFEVSPQNLSGNLQGSLSAGTGTKLVAGNTAVTHSSSSTSNPKVWSFGWTAPNPGVGDVTFYGAFTVNEPVTKLSTMTVSQQLFTGTGDPWAVASLRIYPNPASDHMEIDFYTEKNILLNTSLIDLSGNETLVIKDQVYQPGQHHVTIHLKKNLPDGMYMLRLRADDAQTIRKMIIRH